MSLIHDICEAAKFFQFAQMKVCEFCTSRNANLLTGYTNGIAG